MRRFGIRSRLGNLVLGTVGAAYALGALVVLVYSVALLWDSHSLSDRALELGLAASSIAGGAFLLIALTNLRTPARPHRTVAAART